MSVIAKKLQFKKSYLTCYCEKVKSSNFEYNLNVCDLCSEKKYNSESYSFSSSSSSSSNSYNFYHTYLTSEESE